MPAAPGPGRGESVLRSVIFDLDGTLADTAADLIAAANHCFAMVGLGVRLDPKADRATAFQGGRAMLRLGLGRLGRQDESEVERLYPELLAFYGTNIARETRLYAGVPEALDGLAAGGWRLGICTNKPEGLARLLLAELGILDRFASLVGADTLPVRKPRPEPVLEAIRRLGASPARAVLVGDSRIDRDAARSAGIPVLLVSFGPDANDVAALAPDALVPSFAALPAILERCLPDLRRESA
ncbi:MAG TPA: HAD-IA family hydrolase [Paracoccaceae bacterium]|nr:HAD-IA family hydrolase [Paracoccaceae bacterium]